MFGYITADRSQASPEQIQRYSGCYCGLCRTLRRRHGLLGRLTLTYDMTFLVLVLSSLYEPEEQAGMDRCPVHPLKKRPYWTTEFTGYAADMNLLLAWWNALDDWQDERKLRGWFLHRRLRRRCKRLEKQYPRQSAAIRDALSELSRYEQGKEVSADRAADCFGRLMGELFVVREEDHWADTLRSLGHGLGQFIYILDACLDYAEDQRKGLPNPLLALGGGPRRPEDDAALLSMLLAEASQALERLPMLQDMDLMRNILYAGVWQKYHQAHSARGRRGTAAEEGEGNP